MALRRSQALLQVHLVGTKTGTTGWGVHAGVRTLPAMLAIDLAFAVMHDEEATSGVPLICIYCTKPILPSQRERRPRRDMPPAHIECNLNERLRRRIRPSRGKRMDERA